MKTYIIAEAGVNHNGSLKMAHELIDVAVDAKVDAVKFQTFKAEQVISKNAPKAEYQKQTTGASESQLDMVKKLQLSEDAHQTLIEYCQKKEIEFLSTPFDLGSVDLLSQRFALKRMKLPSGEITNAPLLLRAARTSCDLILSTGMCSLQEIETALGVLAFGFLALKEKPSSDAFRRAFASAEGRQALKKRLSLLHCTTEYPAPFAEVNLRAMETMRTEFGLPVGYSDHTRGIAVPIAAVALGATIIEKHFTLDRSLPGPDHAASLEPDELQAMVQGIRQIELAVGSPQKKASPSEEKNKVIARKSLVAACRIEKGEIFSEDNLAAKRPGGGISAINYYDWLGRKAEKAFEADEEIVP